MSSPAVVSFDPPDRSSRHGASPISRLERLVLGLTQARERGDLQEALRMADAARRLTPGDAAISVVYARLLIDCGNYTQALEHLTDADQPGALAARAEALCQLGRTDESVALCQSLLIRHAVDCVDGLERALNLLCRLHPERYCGWLGLDAQGHLVGGARGGTRLRWAVGAATRTLRVAGKASGLYAVREAIAPGTTGRLAIESASGPLLGAPLAWPAHFGYTGWVVQEGRALHGEIHASWAPGRPVSLAVETPGEGERRFALSPDGKTGHIPFCVSLWHAAYVPTAVGVALPNGEIANLLGSPVRSVDPAVIWPVDRRSPWQAPAASVAAGTCAIAEPAAAVGEAMPHAMGAAMPNPPAGSPVEPRVDIIVPVYAGREETLLCLQSVLDTVPPEEAELVVVNDASPDAALAAELEELASEGRITLLVNASNLGFSGAVNRAMALHPGRDVVLLNADCEVYPQWLARLRAAAAAAPDIATVTPLGEQASIASYPSASAGHLGHEPAAHIDAIAGRVNAGRIIEVPVGVGFCMYLRRSCLTAVGHFDAETFGRGYGEENDFCLRARRRGWRHVVATDVFVRHSGGRSFGPQRQLLMARHGRLLNARHPGYDALVAEHVARDPLRAARRSIDLARLLEAALKPVLIITHSLGGGVERIVNGRIADLNARGHSVLLLQPSHGGGSVRLQLAGQSFENLRYDMPTEMPALAAALRKAELVGVELHHFLDLPEAVLAFAEHLGIPLIAYLHDYSWICPRLTLLGGDGRYCGEPDLQGCETCVRQNGSAMPQLTVAQLRERSQRLLSLARHVYCATEDVRQRYGRHFPGLPISVITWDEHSARQQRIPPPVQGRARVAVFGAISIQKGHQVIVDCARAAAELDLPLEFVLIGYSCDDAALMDTGRVFVTGPYREDELAQLALREGCHVAWFPSVTPETWCCTLNHAMAEGLPILAFDIGALAERLSRTPLGHLLPLGTSTLQINQRLIALATHPPSPPAAPSPAAEPDGAPQGLARKALARDAAIRDDVALALPGISLESSSPRDPKIANAMNNPIPDPAQASPTLDVDALAAVAAAESLAPQPEPLPAAAQAPSPPATAEQSASVQMLNLPEGVYAFSIRSGAPEGRHGEQMTMPALNIGLAPVQSTGMVEFFGGPGTLDRWLAFASDRVYAQVTGESAGLLLTSLRLPEHPALGIHISRVDTPVPTVPGAPPLVLAHVRQLGDLYFSADAVGPFGSGLWIEAFVVEGTDAAGAALLEYRSLTFDRYETPWLSDGVLCGSRGRGTPLLGFAARLRVAFAQQYDCTYTGHFASGRRVGPLADGSLCRSEEPDDPLTGMEIRIAPRA